MGSVRKASAWLGLVDDNNDERYYDGYEDDAADGPEAAEAWVTDPRVKVAADVAQDKGRIGTITPDSFRDARAIGELFRDGVPVIMNLTSMEPGDAKRVVDFAAGRIFGLRGSIDR
ncbi:cell division protein SepF, partial [Streptomyces lasiicapitis]|uniref:cell division protein SepF n=1 Tax=Streptomyces lasiicapitis TaxID=1923961 RepID=UPI00367B066A